MHGLRPRRAQLPKNLAGTTVLVVDDDADTVELFAVALGACGATVRTATSAVTALRMIAESGVDVIVTDIAMPDGDGYWLLDEVRRLPHETARSIPVIAATAFGEEHSRTRTLAAGFEEHLRKPVDPELLCRAVAAVARGSEPMETP